MRSDQSVGVHDEFVLVIAGTVVNILVHTGIDLEIKIVSELGGCISGTKLAECEVLRLLVGIGNLHARSEVVVEIARILSTFQHEHRIEFGVPPDFESVVALIGIFSLVSVSVGITFREVAVRERAGDGFDLIRRECLVDGLAVNGQGLATQIIGGDVDAVQVLQIQ